MTKTVTSVGHVMDKSKKLMMWAVKLTRPINEVKWTKEQEEADKAHTGLRPVKAKREALDLKGWVRSFPVKDLVDPWEHPGAASGLAMLTLWETQHGKFPTSAESVMKSFTRALSTAFKQAGEPFSVMPPVAVMRPIAANCPTCHHIRFPVLISHPPPGFDAAWKERLRGSVKEQWAKPRYTPRQKKTCAVEKEDEEALVELEDDQETSEEEASDCSDDAAPYETTPEPSVKDKRKRTSESPSSGTEGTSSESDSSSGSWIFHSRKQDRKRTKTKTSEEKEEGREITFGTKKEKDRET